MENISETAIASVTKSSYNVLINSIDEDQIEARISCFPDCSRNCHCPQSSCGNVFHFLWVCNNFDPMNTLFFGEFVSLDELQKGSGCNKKLSFKSFELAWKLNNNNLIRGTIRRWMPYNITSSFSKVKIVFDQKVFFFKNIYDINFIIFF